MIATNILCFQAQFCPDALSGVAAALGRRTLAATSADFPPAQGLWGGKAGTYAGVEPFALGPAKLKKLYGPAALGRAKAWTKAAKVRLIATTDLLPW